MTMGAATSIPALDALGRVLEYPGPDLPGRLEVCRATLAGSHPGAARFVEGAIAALEVSSVEGFEETYARSFDLKPACAPYATVHLFGEESFKRGEFMARLQGRYAEEGFDAGSELPDHVSLLLRFAARAGRDEAGELAQYCLMTPLARMAAALDEANPFALLLRAAGEVLREQFPDRAPAPLPIEQMRTHGGAGGCGDAGATPSPCAAGCGAMAASLKPETVDAR